MFDKIVMSYTEITCDGRPIMTKQEANIFKEYLSVRSAWLSEIYVEYLTSHNSEIPISVAGEEMQL